MRFVPRFSACGALLLCLAQPVSAQYMRIITDNPTDNTRLRPTGTTILTVTLNTNHDRDGSLQTCNSHAAANCGGSTSPNALTLFSYQVYLRAIGGAVSWGTFTPDSSAFQPLAPQVSNTTDVVFVLARPPGTSSPPGFSSLGRIPVTITSGAPAIEIARLPDPIPLDPAGLGTLFGTNCDGTSLSNSYVLGNASDPCGVVSGLPPDWYDADGAGAPAGSGNAPVLNPISNMTIGVGGCAPATADQAISATDPDGDAITFIFTGPAWMSVTSNAQVGNTRTGNIHLSAPPPGTSGNFPASVTATAGGQSDTKPFTIFVVTVNQTPVLAQPANMTVNEGATASQTITGSDACGAPLTFTKVSGPVFMTVTTTNATTGNVHLAPGFTDSGTFAGIVRATNSGGLSDTKSFSITVNNVNRPPVMNSIPPVTVNEGSTVDVMVTASDPDGDPLTFNLGACAPFGVFNAISRTIRLSPGFNDAGTYSCTISVSDGQASVSQTFAITVINVNRAPTLNPVTNMTVCEGSTQDQVITGSDPDGDALTFSKVSGPTYMTVTTTSPTTGNIHLAPGFADAGTASGTARASDGSLSSDRSFTIFVTNGCRPPVLNPISDMTVTEGATADQMITGSDADGEALSFSKTFGPLFMTVTTTNPGTGSATGNIHLAPGFADAGSYLATVSVTDGGLSASRTFSITVNPGANRCPTADGDGPYSGLVGTPVVFDGTGSSDPDGEPLTYSWDFGDGNTGTGATPSHIYGAEGTYAVTLTVADPSGCSDVVSTVATIVSACPATVFNGYDTIRLGSGKPFWFAYVQPSTGCYDNTDVVISSFVMKYAGREISASGKSSVGGDKSGDGIQEIRISFSKGDLRVLFAGLPSGHNLVDVTLEATLVSGALIQGTTQLDVVSTGSFSAPTVAPNPLNPAATLTYTTSRTGFVRIELFDIHGRLVRRLVDEPAMAAGTHEVTIDGRGARGEKLSSGVYFVRGRSTEGEFKKLITILK